MLKTFVKIGAVNNLSDARYCAGMMVDQLGFQLDSEGISKESFDAITGWVEGVGLVGEFESNDINIIKTALLEFPVDYVQVNSTAVIDALASMDYKLILKADFNRIMEISDQYSDHVTYFLLEDHEMSMEQLKDVPSRDNIVLSSLINSVNLETVLALGFKGIAMKGGDEIRPGVKDFDELADVLEALETD